MNLLEKTSCNFCQEAKVKLLFRATDRQYDSVPSDVWCHVVRCKKCGLIYLNPRIKEKYIEKFYPKTEYYTQTSVNEDYLKKLKNDLFQMVASLYFKYPDNKINFESRVNHILLRLSAIIVFKIFPFTYRRLLPYVSNGKILDFGFGDGSYLCRMKNLSWESWGVEIDKKIIEKMKKKSIFAFSDLWNPKIPENYFDWVTTYHSFEHLYDPKSVIKRISEILKRGGKIYIGVPNFNSLARKIFKSYWYNLSVPIHLHFFTKDSITNFLINDGFADIKIYYRSSTQGILGSIQHIINALIGRLTKKKHTKMFLRDNLLLRLLFTPIIKIIDYLHMGDRIEIEATKK